MIRLACLFLIGVSGFVPIHADEFAIALKIQAGQPAKTVEAKNPAASPKGEARPILMAGVNTPITVKWTVSNSDKAATVKDALVHFFVVKEAKPDQQEVPKLNKNVVAETALTMDFKPQDKSEAELTFTVANSGTYLLRLEIKGTAAKAEPFAAIDLIVR